MGNSTNFLFIVYFICIITLIVSGIIEAFFVIPQQIKQAQVRDALGVLRNRMLAKGFLSLFVIVFAIFCLTARFFITDADLARYVIVSLVLFFCLGILGKAIIDSLIYNEPFDKSNELHALMEIEDDRQHSQVDKLPDK